MRLYYISFFYFNVILLLFFILNIERNFFLIPFTIFRISPLQNHWRPIGVVLLPGPNAGGSDSPIPAAHWPPLFARILGIWLSSLPIRLQQLGPCESGGPADARRQNPVRCATGGQFLRGF